MQPTNNHTQTRRALLRKRLLELAALQGKAGVEIIGQQIDELLEEVLEEEDLLPRPAPAWTKKPAGASSRAEELQATGTRRSARQYLKLCCRSD